MDLSWRVVSGYAPHALQWIDLQAQGPRLRAGQCGHVENHPDLVCSPRCE